MYGLSGFSNSENLELRKFNGKLCTLIVRNVWFCGEIEYPKFHKFSQKSCTLDTYGMSRFAEKLKIQNCVNSTGNCVHKIYGLSRFADKLKIHYCVNSNENCVH